jgi:heme/copper-type cytochrome/quinol oxidase subunit 3
MGNAKFGTGLFIASEAVFFLMLMATYVYLHNATQAGPSAADLDVTRTSIFTVFLLASSPTMWLAGLGHKRDNPAAVRGWLLATIALGAVFLVGQGTEYWRLIQQNLTISRNVFGSTFYILTGFHGLHVLGGLILLMLLLGLTWAGRYEQPRKSAVESIGMYWHFVDGVWIFIFSLVYLRLVP